MLNENVTFTLRSVPFLGKHIPHIEEIFPYPLPQISPKGACGETFPQASPYPQSMGNVEGMPSTLGDMSLRNIDYN